MYQSLKAYCKKIIDLEESELDLIDMYFKERTLRKKQLLFREGKVCDFMAFIVEGSIRHFHVKDGDEKTCDISFEHSWVTDFQSFTHAIPGQMNLQAMENTKVLFIDKKGLLELYQKCSKYETFGRIMTEQVLQKATEIAMSLSADKPEERFQKLLNKQPELFQRVPQKYIANFLGISPESLSRIRKRIFNKKKDLT